MQADIRDAAAGHSEELLAAYDGVVGSAAGLLEDLSELVEALYQQNTAGVSLRLCAHLCVRAYAGARVRLAMAGRVAAISVKLHRITRAADMLVLP